MEDGGFAFGDFVLNAAHGILVKSGTPLPVSHRGLLLLEALLRQPGKVLTKTELIDAAWPGMAVEDGNLTVQIAALRKLLGEAPGGGDWISTVPRVGYRFVPRSGAPEGRPAARTLSPAKPSLAVLPFANLSVDPSGDYFADGVVEDILTALSRFRSFAVVARNSSFAYKGRSVDIRRVAEDLGVRYVLQGSVRRAGDRLRITSELIDAHSGHHIWADRFDGSVDEVFEFQDLITVGVATVVEPRIREAEIENSRRERPESVAAYDLYLRALPLNRAGTQRENAEAYALLSRAVAIEPRNTIYLAWTLDMLSHRTAMGWPMLTGDDRAMVRDYLYRALFEARDDAAVLSRCGNALIQVTREYELGLATLQRALGANPNSVEAMTFAGIGHLHCGDPEEARACFEGAMKLSPNDPYAFIPLTGVAHAEMILARYEQARFAAEQSMMVSAGYDPTYWMLIASNAHLGRIDEAVRWRERYIDLSPGVTLQRIRAAQPPDPVRFGSILSGLELAGMPSGTV